MAQAAPNEKTAAESQPAATEADKIAKPRPQAGVKPRPAAPHLAAAATMDELLAKEALASLKRMRGGTVRNEPVKAQPRVQLPPARIVVKPRQPQPWMTPFITLAVMVGISTFLTTGGITFLFMRPLAVASASDAEIRNLRETVAQLRRNVVSLSNDVASNRTAVEAASRAATDRYGRFVQSLDSIERAQTVSATKIERIEEKTQAARPVPVAATQPASASPEITGTLRPDNKPVSARRDPIAGWRVRRAYEGVAIVEGQPGVIEVVLGQDVPNLGRVEDIRQENGRWTVVTSKGVISSR